MEWLESILAHRLSHGSAAFAGAGAAGGGDGGAGEQPAAPPLARRPSSVARAVPQETVHMRRVSQLASVAGLAEGPLLAAAGEADIALEDARLHTRHADWSAPSLKPPRPPSLPAAPQLNTPASWGSVLGGGALHSGGAAVPRRAP